MEVTCRSCQRVFDLDDARAAKVQQRLRLRESSPRFPPASKKQRARQVHPAARSPSVAWARSGTPRSSGVEGFEREVAIKKMLPHLSADRDFVNMLVKEAKLTVLLNHPNIVQVYDLAKEGEEYYIAMEYVPAINVGNLLEYCRSNELQLPVPVAAHIAMQLLKGPRLRPRSARPRRHADARPASRHHAAEHPGDPGPAG